MPAKVLLVDDEAKVLALGCAALSRRPGVETLVARNGEEALEVCLAEHPDLVFLDVMMPKKDGYTVCRAIKQDPAIADIKVVIVTALAQQATVIQATAAGADGYMTKPFRPSELLEKADEYLTAA